MTKEIAVRHEGGVSVEHAEALARAQLQATVERLYGQIERGGRGSSAFDMLPSLPSHDLRTKMQTRRTELHGKLRAIGMARGEQETARRAIAALLGGYLNIKTDNPEAVAAGYVAHLAEQPVFAILQACDDFKHHRVVDHYDDNGKPVYFTMDHAPSAFRLLDQVKKCAEAARVEHHQIGRLLAVIKEIPKSGMTDTEQAAVAVAMRALADGVIQRVDGQRRVDFEKTRVEAQAARDRAAGIIENARRRNAALEQASQDERATGER